MAGKIITIDWELIASLPSDEYHIKLLNKQQSAILLALCEYQHWTSRWDNLGLSQHELDRFVGDIEFRLMGDEAMPVDCEDIEDCIEASPTITTIQSDTATNTSNIGTLDDEVNVIQQQQGTKNDVPPASSYTGDALCKASSYISKQIVDGAGAVYSAKNSTGFADWIGSALQSGGYIGAELGGLWDALDGGYTSTLAELASGAPYLTSALYGSNLDRATAKAAVIADSAISSHAKDAFSNMLDALTDGKMSDWAMAGSAGIDALCGENYWQWSFLKTSCTYNMPAGWFLNPFTASCGDGPGTFDGFYQTRNSLPAGVTLTITFPSQMVRTVNVSAQCNLFTGFVDGSLRVRAYSGVTMLYDSTQTLPRTGWTVHKYLPAVVCDKIEIVASQNFSTANPTGVSINKISINAALL